MTAGLTIFGSITEAIIGFGDVTGPTSSTDNAISRFDGITGKIIQNSLATIDDSGNLSANNFSGSSSGTNTGDQTITLTGDVTGSGTGSFATTIGAAKVTNAMLAGSIAASKLVGTDIATVGTLTAGATGAGFTIALSSSTITGDLPFANLTQGSARSVLAVAGNSTADFASVQGTADQVLVINSAGTALAFGALNLSAATATTGTLPVGVGGTGQTSYTNGQLLIGNTTGNTLTKATLTGTSNQITVTNGVGSITLATPQDIGTASTPQFAKVGIGAAAHATSIFYAYNASSSNTILVETGGATSQAGLQCKITGVRTFSFSTRADLDANGAFSIADETASAIRVSMDKNGWFGVGGAGLSRIHSIENTTTASERGIISEQFINGTSGGSFIGRKARISGSSRISINTADILADYNSQGHDGTGFIDAGKIRFISTGTIGTGRVPCDLVFFTATDVTTSVVTEAARFTNAQVFQLVSTIGKYNNINTVSNGVPSELAKVDTTALTANVGATTLYAVPASGAGMYRVSSLAVETTAGSISSTLPNVQIVYTDNETGGTVTIDATPVLGVAGIGQTGALTANTIGTTTTGVIVINAKASTNIQYQTVNYASSLAGMAYALHIKLEAM